MRQNAPFLVSKLAMTLHCAACLSWISVCPCQKLIAQNDSTNVPLQRPEPQLYQDLLTDYQKAKNEFESGKLQQSAATYRSVASRCAGSELELQCEYLAAHAEWIHDPCEDSLSTISNWYRKFEQYEKRLIAGGRKLESNLLRSWADRSQYLQARWEREHDSLDDAEKRLRTLLQFDGGNPQLGRCPEGWLELGELLREDRKQFDAATACFQKALELSEASSSNTHRALWGLALTSWKQQQTQKANEWLTKLLSKDLDDSSKIQARLLQVKIARGLGKTGDTLQELEPLLQIALAGTPQASVMYDLAMTLVELGQTSKGDSVLIQLVHRFPNTPLSVDARIRLARHASEQGAWRDVEKWCSQAMELQCSEQLKPHVLAMRGQAYAQLGKPDPAIADFHTALANPDLGLDLQIAIRFHLSESLYLQEKWREAEPHWQWLSSIIASQTASKAKSEDWHPIVLLRSAEMLAVKKEWKRAEEIVLSIRNDFPECSKRAEVDYLYARCLVSKADFEAARTALAMLAQSEGSHAELYARANWMIGETYLMQRRHAEACLAYQQVLDIPQQPNWHAAALLQIGHCHEATSDLLKARTAYERILNVFPDSPYVSTAQSRLNRIPSQSHLQTADAKNATGPKR